MVLGMKPDQVKVIYSRGSGCYGINGADTVSYDAALMSQAVGRPVRVQLSRKDEMAHENFGLAFVVDQRAGLDAKGNIVAWDYEAWSPLRGGRPGHTQPGNQVTGYLAGFPPAPFAPRSPAPAPTGPLANGSNVVPSYVTGTVGGAAGGTGTVTSERCLSRVVESPFWTGPLRSPNRLQNTFAHECMMDELAAAAKADPVEFRLRHLKDQRLKRVVQEAASAANWQARPSPIPNPQSQIPKGIVSGRGIACVLYEGDNGYCAMVAEVAVNLDTGAVDVTRLVMALDSGPISNPDGLRNQAEGGALARAEPRAVRRGDVGRRESDVGGLADIPNDARGCQNSKAPDRAHQHDGGRGERGRGDVDHRHGGSNRKCDFRRDRREDSAGAVYARTRSGRAGVTTEAGLPDLR